MEIRQTPQPARTAPEGSGCRRRRRPLPPTAMAPAGLLRMFFLTAVAFLVAGAVVAALARAGVLGWWGGWLALHLVLLGGVSQLVLGAGQFFTTAFLATHPPRRAVVRAQVILWSAGTVAVAIGVPARRDPLVDAGAGAIAVGLVLFASSLLGLERRSLNSGHWAVRWYYASAIGLGVGVVLGVLMARGVAWSGADLLAGHLSCNLLGWMGTAIVGTLHTFHPSLTRTRLRHPRLQGPTFQAWTAGVVLVVAGYLLDAGPVVAVGWLALTAATALLAVNVVAGVRAAPRPLALPALLVGAAQAFLVAGMLVATVAVIADGPHSLSDPDRRPLLTVLFLGGWIGLTVTGSLLHLLAVLRHIRRFPAPPVPPRPRRDRWTAVAAVGALVVLVVSRLPGVDSLARPAEALATAVALAVAAGILVLAVQVALPPRAGPAVAAAPSDP
jgi:nitrite reductase (NO-forming)